MSYSIRELKPKEFPSLLLEITDKPKKLYCSGQLPPPDTKLLSVVGSRKYSTYGKEVCEKLISELKGFPVSIVSGLALGIDSIAHKTALKNNLHTIAIPGSGLGQKVLYPSSHIRLAEEIVDSGGALLSEFENDFRATQWSFPQRNRIMAGISHATLVIEAEIKSGTLITSRLATDYNRDVLTVPGSIFSKTSEGPHMLIRLGATPITSGRDILQALGIAVEEKEVKEKNYDDLSQDEKNIVALLEQPVPRDDLIRASGKPAFEINAILTAMEIKGIITESMGEIRLN
jgi:DNA processing protein